jgi:general secretion pathway protein E
MSDDTKDKSGEEENPKWSNLPTVSFRKLQRKTLGQILVESNALTEGALTEALEEQGDTKAKLGEILVEKELISEEDMLRALAYQLDLPYYARLPVHDIDATLVDNIPINFCRDNKILPVAKDDFNVTVAVADPLNIFPIDDLRLILSININMIVSPPAVIDNSINRVFERSNDASQKVLEDLNEPETVTDDLEETRDLLESSDDEAPVIRLVNGLLANAVKEGASDIHIEPYENEIMVRFRIDGTLQDKMQIPKRHASMLATRIKIIGKLNIAEKRIPQDGRIGFRVAGKDIDVRLSTLPTAHGERIVMRLLDKSKGVFRLDQLNLDKEVYEQWLDLIESKHGIVLVTGPTGSGKTSLLYSSLMHINTTDINIVTVEDPVEYQLAGVGQTEVQEKIGLNFMSALRAILRQDPDVVMIGEIRDSETAGIAIQASMTGHLVLSTIHTNDTASTVTRFLDLDVEPFQIASAVLGIMSQRLVRKLCTNCHEQYDPNEEEIKLMNTTKEEIADKKIYRAGPGCDTCFGLAYKDRMGVHELLTMNDHIRDTLMTTQEANAIKKAAIESGMKTLRESAISKVLLGLTSLDEALNKTQEDMH